MCFVLKSKERRIYGYLCNPLTKSRPSFRLCVLCRYTTKNKWETDPAELARVKRWSDDAGAQKAIAVKYPDNVVSIQQGKKDKCKI